MRRQIKRLKMTPAGLNVQCSRYRSGSGTGDSLYSAPGAAISRLKAYFLRPKLLRSQVKTGSIDQELSDGVLQDLPKCGRALVADFILYHNVYRANHFAVIGGIQSVADIDDGPLEIQPRVKAL